MALLDEIKDKQVEVKYESGDHYLMTYLSAKELRWEALGAMSMMSCPFILVLLQNCPVHDNIGIVAWLKEHSIAREGDIAQHPFTHKAVPILVDHQVRLAQNPIGHHVFQVVWQDVDHFDRVAVLLGPGLPHHLQAFALDARHVECEEVLIQVKALPLFQHFRA